MKYFGSNIYVIYKYKFIMLYFTVIFNAINKSLRCKIYTKYEYIRVRIYFP